MGLQRTLADASGRLRTEAKGLIRKRPPVSRRWTPSCQGGCRGFDPRFPLQPQKHVRTRVLRSWASQGRRPANAREFTREFTAVLSSGTVVRRSVALAAETEAGAGIARERAGGGRFGKVQTSSPVKLIGR